MFELFSGSIRFFKEFYKQIKAVVAIFDLLTIKSFSK